MTLTFMVGCFTLLLGLFRIGFLDNVFSRPLLSGFVTALALLTIIEQSDTILGMSAGNLHSWEKVFFVFQNLDQANILAFVIWGYSLVLLLLFKFIKKKIMSKWSSTKLALIKFVPEILVVVVIGILLSLRFDFGARGVILLGAFDTKFPTPKLPFLASYELLQELSIDLFVIVLIGFIEAIIVVRTFAIKHGYPVSANRELVAYGLQNLIGSFFGAYPTFGSLSRTAMNDQAGVKTQISGLIIAALGAEVGVVCCVASSLLLIVRQSTFPPIAIRGREADSNRFQDILVCTDINLFDNNHKWFKEAALLSKKGTATEKQHSSNIPI